jgi:N-acetylated-alpha-linked acidic dipeptidase
MPMPPPHRYDKAVAAALQKGVDAAKIAAFNARLLTAERQLLIPGGLPTRPYYQHALYAPGLYTGYGPKTMSGIRESIELKDYALAESEVVKVAKAVEDEAKFLDQMTSELQH